MKKKLLATVVTAVFSLGVLSACGVNNNRMNDTEDVNYRPVRYEQNNNDRLDPADSNMNPARDNPNNRDNNRGLLNDVQQNDRLYNDGRNHQNPGTGGTMRGQ
ncbi:hypothetical protein ACFFHH_07040 [Cytobacillus solani]|uniref:hypothetical protein n=1 Tax=Cytobacillus solani TaxID=1637975 RepID=UPI0006ABB999|nr:hypothetical protein [Cytobacillus solani]KOP83017.1 hypothetical protein AMS60_11385 [Bacillus sp. FJAT-21945]